MEQLTAVVYVDEADYACVGYKDITDQEFWVRGHMPGLPLMPGVVMLESIAQLCSFVTQRYDLLGAEMVGFGGLEDVRFRDPVLPGDRLIVMCQLEKVRRGRMIVCKFQGVVKDRIVVRREAQRHSDSGRSHAETPSRGRLQAVSVHKRAMHHRRGCTHGACMHPTSVLRFFLRCLAAPCASSIRRSTCRGTIAMLKRLPRPLGPGGACLRSRAAPLEVEVGSGKGLFLAAAARGTSRPQLPGHRSLAASMPALPRPGSPGSRAAMPW